MHQHVERQLDCDGWVERHIRSLLAFVAVIVCMGVVALLVAIAFPFSAQPSLAQVAVPQACIELAAKYGRTLPPVMGRFKANQVKAELKLLSDDDPDVKRCRDAVAKMETKK